MPLPSISDSWERGDPYEQYIGRWSRQVAVQFLAWLSCMPRRWLDVGCGTGALSSAILDQCSPELVVGLEPSPGFIRSAQSHLSGKARFVQCAAEQLPFAPQSFDGVVSGLVLNFIPAPRSALIQMIRILRPGGLIGAYVWDYAGKMEMLRYFWDAAVELDPAAAALDEGPRFPLCQPAALKDLFSSAGLSAVEVIAIDIPTPFASFAEYWQPFLGSVGPAPAYVKSLDERAKERLRQNLKNRLPNQPNGEIHLIARAWAVQGRSDSSRTY